MDQRSPHRNLEKYGQINRRKGPQRLSNHPTVGADDLTTDKIGFHRGKGTFWLAVPDLHPLPWQMAHGLIGNHQVEFGWALKASTLLIDI